MSRIGILSSLLLAGCLFPSDEPQPINTCEPSENNGVLSIQWTIDGQAPSETTCQGIARMQLRVESSCNLGVISPIPCNLDKLRFDQQPKGDLQLTLEAIGTSEDLRASGSISFYARASVPNTPTLIEVWSR